MHRFAYDDEGRVILYIGAENWPTPIPLIKKDDSWIFDTASGKDELVYRRIGRNEIFTIEVLNDWSRGSANTPVSRVNTRRRFLSDPGQQNGLYWKTDTGQPDSPIGPLVASATVEGYKRDNNELRDSIPWLLLSITYKAGKECPRRPKELYRGW